MPPPQLIRLFGAIMAFSGCFSLGLMKLRREKARIHALEALCGALSQMRVELGARLASVPTLADMLSKRAEGDARGFFAALCEKLTFLGKSELCELWAECARREMSALDADELNDFIALGQVLGRGELSSQLDAIANCEDALNRALCAARAEHADKRRLALGVSASAGLMLVIMLI